MPRNIKFATILALVVAHDISTQIRCAKSARLFLQASNAYEETEAANGEMINYLVHMCEKHQVPVSEFDLIALSYHQ